MKKALITGFAILSTLGLIGCGNNAASPSTVASSATTGSNATATTNTASNTTNTAPTSAPAQTALKTQDITLTILPGGQFGSDGKMHDTFSPADFKVVQGVPVKLTVYNYDGGSHSITSSHLGLNVQIKGSSKNGVPALTTYTFTPSNAGDFTWQCTVPCDSEANGWAMSHDGYMMGKITVAPNNDLQYVYLTIKDGLHFASADGKLHDSYSPADFSVQAGIPVDVTVYNYDTGKHSFTSPTLNVNQTFDGASKEGVPSVSHFTFTAQAAGQYHWQCVIPCDGGPTGWAMSHDGYMNGNVTVVE